MWLAWWHQAWSCETVELRQRRRLAFSRSHGDVYIRNGRDGGSKEAPFEYCSSVTSHLYLTMMMLETDDKISVSLSRVNLISRQMGCSYNVFILLFFLSSLLFLHLFCLSPHFLHSPCLLLSFSSHSFSVCSFLFTFCHTDHSFTLPSVSCIALSASPTVPTRPTQHQSCCVSAAWWPSVNPVLWWTECVPDLQHLRPWHHSRSCGFVTGSTKLVCWVFSGSCSVLIRYLQSPSSVANDV